MTWLLYCPQRSCGKVMFLHVSVILSTGEGSGRRTPPGKQTPPGWQTHPMAGRDTPPGQTLPLAGRHPPGRHKPPSGRQKPSSGRQTPPGRQKHPPPDDHCSGWYTILLECILVISNCHSPQICSKLFIWDIRTCSNLFTWNATPNVYWQARSWPSTARHSCWSIY